MSDEKNLNVNELQDVNGGGMVRDVDPVGSVRRPIAVEPIVPKAEALQAAVQINDDIPENALRSVREIR